MDQHQPAVAPPGGGHQRRAVVQPCPGALGQIERGLGQHLPADLHIGGHGQTEERAVCGERRQLRGTAPRQRAADGPVASAQPDRQQRVAHAGIAGEPGTGEAQQHTAALDPTKNGIRGGGSGAGAIGNGENGQLARQQTGHASLSDFRHRCKGALQIVQAAKQRLIGRPALSRHQAHGPPLPTLVDQDHRRGGIFALDLNAGQAVEELRRKGEARVDPPLAVGEANPLPGQKTAVLGQSPQHDDGLAGRVRTDQGENQSAVVNRRSPQHLHRVHRRRGDDGNRSQRLQQFGDDRALPIGFRFVQAIAQPHHRPGPPIGCLGQFDQRFDRRQAVGLPGLGLEAPNELPRLADGNQADRLPRRVDIRRRRRRDGDTAALSFGVVDQTVHHRLTRGPVAGRGPTVVNDHDQRSRSGKHAAGIDQRVSGAENHRQREDDAQHQQPRRRPRRALFGRSQSGKEAHRRKRNPFRRRRRQPQQPPDPRQQDQRQQGDGSGECQ